MKAVFFICIFQRCIFVFGLDINDCQPQPCQNNGTCTDLVNDYQCDCVAGFNGTNCENSKHIIPVCKNGETYIDVSSAVWLMYYDIDDRWGSKCHIEHLRAKLDRYLFPL